MSDRGNILISGSGGRQADEMICPWLYFLKEPGTEPDWPSLSVSATGPSFPALKWFLKSCTRVWIWTSNWLCAYATFWIQPLSCTEPSVLIMIKHYGLVRPYSPSEPVGPAPFAWQKQQPGTAAHSLAAESSHFALRSGVKHTSSWIREN